MLWCRNAPVERLPSFLIGVISAAASVCERVGDGTVLCERLEDVLRSPLTSLFVDPDGVDCPNVPRSISGGFNSPFPDFGTGLLPLRAVGVFMELRVALEFRLESCF